MKPHPIVGTAIIIGAFAALMCGLREYQHRRSPAPERVRKLLHIGMGLTTLLLPWAFATVWPVLALAAVIAAALLAVKHYEPLQRRFGAVLCGVGRTSTGDLYFTLAIAAVFALAQGNALLFSIPVLILTLADAAGALVGVRYGSTHYGGHKSFEGSAAFFAVAFFSTIVPLLLFTEAGRVETLLIALTLGLLAMLLEGVAWRGLDNLFVPLGSFALLKIYLMLDVAALTGRLAAALGLVIAALGVRGKTCLSDRALIAAVLTGYGCWAVGGWLWLATVLLLIAGYAWLHSDNELKVALRP